MKTAARRRRSTLRPAGTPQRLGIACLLIIPAGCAHPNRPLIECYMHHDAAYLALERGPARVDAIWRKACVVAGGNVAALDLLGMLAVDEGLRLKHPFTTGLSSGGMLEPNDKAGHFFAHAMWAYHDFDRLVPIAEFNGFGWEIVGEIRSWFGRGVGFNWKDIWANRLGREFGRRVRALRHDPSTPLLPSDVLLLAERFRPSSLDGEPNVAPAAGTATAGLILPQGTRPSCPSAR